MTDRYPPPSYALSIWLAGDTVMLAIPEAGTIPIPLKRLMPQVNQFNAVVPGNRGLAVLLDLLRSRMANREPTIGERAAPVRYDVEQALASDTKYVEWQKAMAGIKALSAAEKAEASELLRELGI